ncbi:histidine kinase [Streptomyces sp. NBC_01142]|uniref:sensor histidine kinase n=1 Tax=Streptomyces sp. NBC_01142 TaxID=2975865 RepID=UPI002254C5C6|nr:histidine kinase [Streptomyces sp. NBC_01142]MCX4820285.1 histidine kinase [Streptomyces sp. NBC_01142]
MTRTEYPWLLPSAMSDPLDPDLTGSRGKGRGKGKGAEDGKGTEDGKTRARPRRTVRDWIVDTSVFVLAAILGMLASEASTQAGNPELVVLADQLLGAAACCALWVRRRAPVGLAGVLVVLASVAPAAGGALLVSLFSLAVHRTFKPVATVGVLAVVSSAVQAAVRPDPATSFVASLITSVILVLLMTGWGMLVRARRQLVVALRERARRAENEAELRAAHAQRLAREAIAREMHDVLAHRLTLLSVHAGALEFRPDAPPAEVARAAGVIRDSAHEALQDLREIIGVLRAPGDGDGSDRPQPTLATLEALVAESRQADMLVTLDNRVTDPASAPAATGRTVYRIAQEGLTNARKHAPGTEVTVAVSGGPGQGLTVDVENPAPLGEVEKVPGSGQGLIGLTERATLAGGRLEHGATDDGGFHVRAWLPWPS